MIRDFRRPLCFLFYCRLYLELAMNVASNFDIFVFFREFGTLENGIAL